MALEDSFIYFPTRELIDTPARRGLAYEDVRFGQADELHGWFVPGAGPTTILWFHGNAGNVSHRVDWLVRLRARLGANVFIFDYRGYGRSRGQPSEQGLYQDAREALAYLRTRSDVDQARIVYLGKSLGGAAAVQLATEAPPHRLILQAAFTSLPDLARHHYPFLPTGLLLRSRYPTVERIARVGAPVLVAHGDQDEVVPVRHAHALYAAAAEPKRLLIVPGAGHNDILEVGGETYLEELQRFIDSPAS